MEFVSHSYAETVLFGREFAQKLKDGGFVALYGDLGAGKTAFVTGLARGLGCRDDVTSPTYTIMQEYRGVLPLYHFDMYRITDMDSLYSTGFFDFIDTKCVIAVEWSENIPFALPDNYWKVSIKYGKDENERVISFEKV